MNMVQVHYVPCLWLRSAICSRTTGRSLEITRHFEQVRYLKPH